MAVIRAQPITINLLSARLGFNSNLRIAIVREALLEWQTMQISRTHKWLNLIRFIIWWSFQGCPDFQILAISVNRVKLIAWNWPWKPWIFELCNRCPSFFIKNLLQPHSLIWTETSSRYQRITKIRPQQSPSFLEFLVIQPIYNNL